MQVPDFEKGEIVKPFYEPTKEHLARLSESWCASFSGGKMAVRKQLFERVMDIQRRAGVVLVTPEDESFIKQCWANNVYPRGWGPEDELTEAPSETPLFDLPMA